MKSIKKIAVIGGTGKAGRYLVEELLRRGYSLRLLLRDPSSYLNPDPLVEIIPGDARRYETVKALAEGCEAIVSALGQPAGQPSIF
jgi:nucleoside-diphosphate-sugar epimerase